MKRHAIVALVLLAATARADVRGNVWQRATADAKTDTADDKYESEMRQGDEHAMLANVATASLAEVKRQLQLATTAYRAAAAAKPNDGEPYFRIGKLLFSFYFDCINPYASQRAALTCPPRDRPGLFNRDKASEVIAAWDAFEARAPLDPRLSAAPAAESEILFDRAILHTRLATPQHWKAAAEDYEKLLSRQDGDSRVNDGVLSNLAETYMMLGRMEDALETYREALRGAQDTPTFYGYAVALDRDESTRQALEVIKALGREQRDSFYVKVQQGGTFFVPDGEKYYYFALSDEAFGFEDEAIDNWQKFINSKAHPEFQPRAKAHLDALLAKKTRRKALPIEMPWERFR